MGIVTIDKPGKEAFADNQQFDDLSFTSATRDFKPPMVKLIDWKLATACIAGLTSAYLIIWLAYSSWKAFYCWDQHWEMCAKLASVEPYVWLFITIAPLVLSTIAIGLHLFTKTRQSIALSNRTNLVLDRFGDPMPADVFQRIDAMALMDFLTRRYLVANQLEQTIAPHKIYRSVNSLSLNNSTTNQPNLLSDVEIDDSIKPIKPDVWLTWIDKQPHILLAGATGKGKTVTAKPIIAPRIANGEQILIIDPHADYWFGLDVVGGGENWEEIKSAIQQVADEYKSRQMAREVWRREKHESMPVNAFKRLTVFMDEGYLTCLNTSDAPKGKLSTWEQFSEVLTSGARKVNINCVMLSQTANVEDLGISGPLRENFTRIAVDVRAIKLMISKEETDPSRKLKLYDTLIGMEYPATTVVDASVVLLDRTGLDQVPDPAVRSENNWPFKRQTHTNGNAPNIIKQLRALRSQGITRDEARNEYGLQFDNADWGI